MMNGDSISWVIRVVGKRASGLELVVGIDY
jgi:hypothetical protein